MENVGFRYSSLFNLLFCFPTAMSRRQSNSRKKPSQQNETPDPINLPTVENRPSFDTKPCTDRIIFGSRPGFTEDGQQAASPLFTDDGYVNNEPQILYTGIDNDAGEWPRRVNVGLAGTSSGQLRVIVCSYRYSALELQYHPMNFNGWPTRSTIICSSIRN